MPRGIYKHEKIDMTGCVIGYIRVDGIAYYDEHGSGHWNCTCLYKGCGKSFIRTRQSLISHSKDANCGCYSRIKRRDISIKNHDDCISHLPHGERLRCIYKDMISRCYKENQKSYKDYGLKGVQVCEEWKNSKRNFYYWAINNGYRDDLTIDRIDSNGNYEPNNCRWVDRFVQNNNTSRNVRYEYKGGIYSIKELSKVSGVKIGTIISRLRKGYCVDDACKNIHFLTGKKLRNFEEIDDV